MQLRERAGNHSPLDDQQTLADEPLKVDGTLVTKAAELPPEAYDLTDYRPFREPVSWYRRFGRGRAPAVDGDDGQSATTEQGVSWSEALRRQLWKRGHPKGSVLDVRCERRHRLLWLLLSPWGLVPISHTADEPDNVDAGEALTWTPLGGEPVRRTSVAPSAGRFTSGFHGQDVALGRPRTLEEWPDDEPVPAASCPCYGEVVLTAGDVRRILRSAGRSATYRRNGLTV